MKTKLKDLINAGALAQNSARLALYRAGLNSTVIQQVGAPDVGQDGPDVEM